MGFVQYLKKAGRWFAPPPAKGEDGRDQWPSRAAFLLAAMGGCAGQGNLLRYPSVVYNNYGLQWFIPYLLAVFLIAIPALILEISIGQAYRGGTVIAFNNVHRRLKGVGMGPIVVSFIVVQYFTVNLAWIMNNFRNSFTSPLPWENRIQEFYMGDVVNNVDPVVGSLTEGNGAVAQYTKYPEVALLGETVGWSAFVWFLVWISIVRGLGMTGRVVYFTMGIPIATTIILFGRSLSLDNACEGVRLLWATWRGSQLASGTVWQTAVGQVFFSTGIGFGSYNAKHSNTVMDAILICGSNVLFENFAALAVFGIVGYLRMWLQDSVRLGAFVVGFLTLPEAVLQMPVVLGFSSAFVMLDAVAILVVDSVLKWINNVALIFVVWSEVISATTVYRWTDVTEKTGLPAFVVYNVGYLGGQVVSVSVAHGVENPAAGAGAGFGLYIVCTLISIIISKTPDARALWFWNKNAFLRRSWFLALYSGNQLRRDLNQIVGGGKNWKILSFWPLLLRYISAPTLAIIFSFAYPELYTLRYDPLMITGFILAHLGLLLIVFGFILLRYYEIFIPLHRRDEATEVTAMNEPKGEVIARVVADGDEGEAGLGELPVEDKGSVRGKMGIDDDM